MKQKEEIKIKINQKGRKTSRATRQIYLIIIHFESHAHSHKKSCDGTPCVNHLFKLLCGFALFINVY